LRVVVRVVVDDPRHQRQAVGVDGLLGGKAGLADFQDLPVLDREVAAPRRRAQAVDEQRVANHQVMHRGSVYLPPMFDLTGKTAVVTGGAKVHVLDIENGCDVTDEGQVKAAFERIRDIDILVNNAGRAARKPAVELSAQDWDDVIALNLTAVFCCSKNVFPHMKRRGGGSIVNLASIMGLSGGIYPNASYQ